MRPEFGDKKVERREKLDRAKARRNKLARRQFFG
jgi:hypothetical protein